VKEREGNCEARERCEEAWNGEGGGGLECARERGLMPLLMPTSNIPNGIAIGGFSEAFRGPDMAEAAKLELRWCVPWALSCCMDDWVMPSSHPVVLSRLWRLWGPFLIGVIPTRRKLLEPHCRGMTSHIFTSLYESKRGCDGRLGYSCGCWKEETRRIPGLLRRG
jgi:hypothetical protein